MSCLEQEEGSDVSSSDALSNQKPRSSTISIETFADEQETLDALTHKQLYSLLKQLHYKWISQYPQPLSTENAYRLLNVSSKDTGDYNKVELHYKRACFQALRLYLCFVSEGLISDDTNETVSNGKTFARILETIYYTHTLVLSTIRIQDIVTGTDEQVPDELFLHKFSFPDDSETQPYHQVLLFLLRRLYEQGYRRRGASCMEQIRSRAQEGSNASYPTHAWKPTCTIPTFIYAACDKETHYHQWLNANIGGNIDRATKYLTACQDSEFPDYVPDRHVWSFDDALFDAKNKKIYQFGKHRIPHDLVACRYFNKKFRFESFLKFKDEDWYDIPTPHLQHVLEYQGLEREVIEVFYAMIGRLFYDVNELDRWEILLFIKGVANSGKSTLGNFIKRFYSPEDVVVLSNNIEKKFGLQAFLNKFLFICLEVKKNFGLDQGDFQSIITGEDVSVAIKFKEALTTMLRCTGIIFGNENGPWVDAQGSMDRRLLSLLFGKKVTLSNTLLSRELDDEVDAIIYKCNLAYHALVRKCSHTNIWPHLPAYFKETRKKMTEGISALSNFLHNHDKIRKHPEYYIPWNEFCEELREFCRITGMTMPRMIKDHYESVFNDEGIQCLKGEIKYPDGSEREGMFVLGVGLREWFEVNGQVPASANATGTKATDEKIVAEEKKSQEFAEASKQKQNLPEFVLRPTSLGDKLGSLSFEIDGDAADSDSSLPTPFVTRKKPAVSMKTGNVYIRPEDMARGYVAFSSSDIIADEEDTDTVMTSS